LIWTKRYHCFVVYHVTEALNKAAIGRIIRPSYMVLAFDAGVRILFRSGE